MISLIRAAAILASMIYGHRAMGDILPLRDAFVSVFFVSLGMLFDTQVVLQQPGLTFALFRRMQEVIRAMLGISELHKRMASLMHICCARAL